MSAKAYTTIRTPRCRAAIVATLPAIEEEFVTHPRIHVRGVVSAYDDKPKPRLRSWKAYRLSQFRP
jgi:hypothetical protein